MSLSSDICICSRASSFRQFLCKELDSSSDTGLSSSREKKSAIDCKAGALYAERAAAVSMRRRQSHERRQHAAGLAVVFDAVHSIGVEKTSFSQSRYTAAASAASHWRRRRSGVPAAAAMTGGGGNSSLLHGPSCSRRCRESLRVVSCVRCGDWPLGCVCCRHAAPSNYRRGPPDTKGLGG